MTAPVEQAPVKQEEKQESKIQAADYSCEILLEKTTEDKATDKSFPLMLILLDMLKMEHSIWM